MKSQRFSVANVFALLVFALTVMACDLSSLVQLALPQLSPTMASQAQTSNTGNFITNSDDKRCQIDTFDPIGITDSFPADQKVFHAVITIKDAPKDTAVRVTWLSTSNAKMGEFELKSSGSRNLDFSFTPDNGKLPPGNYKGRYIWTANWIAL